MSLESGFRAAMVVCAGLLVVAAALLRGAIDNDVLRPADDQPVPEPECQTSCPVGAPPLEPAAAERPHRVTGTKLSVSLPAAAPGGATQPTTRKPAPMRWSQMHIPTLREDPADAEAPSHRLLLRAGYIRQLMAGHYSLLPLAVRVRAKVIGIIRQEMDLIGAQEVLLPDHAPGGDLAAQRALGHHGRRDVPAHRPQGRRARARP